MTRIDYDNGVHKDMGKAQAHVVNLGDKTSMKIVLEPGFDWVSEVGPKLPGCPAWCPANHFGYLEKGTMKVKYQDGSDVTINAEGESEVNLNFDLTDTLTIKGSVDNEGETGVGLFFQRDY